MKIRYYGHVGERTGYGRAAEGTCMSLLAAGADVQIRPLGARSSSPHRNAADGVDMFRSEIATLAARCSYEWDASDIPDVVIIHTLPYFCRDTLIHIAGAITTGASRPKMCAYTTWEGWSPPSRSGHYQNDVLPQSVALALNEFDAVFVPCRANQHAARNLQEMGTPVGLLPHAAGPDDVRAAAAAARCRGPETTFRFYYIGAWNGRKNPTGLLRAYIAEFTPDDDVELVLQCRGATREDLAVACASTGIWPSHLPKIRFNNNAASNEDVWGLHRDGDCFVTATRGEAWNYPAFDAMLAYRNMIVPSGMGHDDFLSKTSAVRISGSAQWAHLDVAIGGQETEHGVPIRASGPHGLTSRTLWREPNLLELSATMRYQFDTRSRHLTYRVGYDPAEEYSHHRVGRDLLTKLENM